MDIIMPQLGETVEEGTVAAWLKQPGDPVAVDEIILEIETDKVATEVPALIAGILTEILVPAGEVVKVGTVLARISAAGAATQPTVKPAMVAPQPVRPPASQPAGQQPNRAVRIDPRGLPLSPAVRKLLAQHQLDPMAITGTGKGGRIQRGDVLGHLARKPAPAATRPAPAVSGSRLVPFTSMRRRIAEHMIRSKTTSAHVLQAIEVDFSAVDRVRSFVKGAWKAKHGGSLSYLPFIARALCLALKEFPNLNAHVEGDNLRVFDQIGLAVAIDLDFAGLVAPVIANAGQLSLLELAKAIADLAERARANRLTPDDMVGGSYSLTNNGSFGTLITAPVINQPQVAILSTDGIRKRAWVVDDAEGERVEIRPVGVLAQSFDHRAVDGSTSGAYLQRLKAIIEQHDWAGELI